MLHSQKSRIPTSNNFIKLIFDHIKYYVFCRKKVLAYSSSATGSAKLEEISAAYVEIIEDFQQKALQQGSEDPASAEMLQKCEEMLPGQVGELRIQYSARRLFLLETRS